MWRRPSAGARGEDDAHRVPAGVGQLEQLVELEAVRREREAGAAQESALAFSRAPRRVVAQEAPDDAAQGGVLDRVAEARRSAPADGRRADPGGIAGDGQAARPVSDERHG